MRGKVTGVFQHVQFIGITPAYAGKSHLYGIITVEVRDHPRLCGEKQIWEINADHILGSPPPMRGKGIVSAFTTLVTGITPAYAGKSPILSNVHEVSQDHPRLCGEKLR